MGSVDTDPELQEWNVLVTGFGVCADLDPLVLEATTFDPPANRNFHPSSFSGANSAVTSLLVHIW